MGDRTSYQEGVKAMRVFTDPRFPSTIITYRGGTTFHVHRWIGVDHLSADIDVGPDGDPEYPFYGWEEVDVFTRGENDGDTDVDEAYAHMAAAEWFDDQERFPCEHCRGECTKAEDLDRHPLNNVEVGVYCPDCNRQLGVQPRRWKR